MSNFDDQINKNIAEAASKIIDEATLNELSKNTLNSYVNKSTVPADDSEDERISKPEENTRKRLNRQKGIIGASYRTQGFTPKGKKYLAKESTENKTQFSTLLENYHSNGIKSIFDVLSEEPDNETFTKEVEKAKKKASEKTLDDNEIAKAAVQAVKNEDTINEIYYKLVAPSGEVHSKHSNESAALSIKDSSPSFKSYKVVPVIGESIETKKKFSEFKKQSVTEKE